MTTLLKKAGGIEAIEKMLRDFYGKAHQDELIGPIFSAKIQDWEYHFQKVVVYWRRQTEAEPNYHRTFRSKHEPLGVKKQHFERWLALFQETCREHFTADVGDDFIHIAYEVAARLYMHIAGTDEPYDFR